MLYPGREAGHGCWMPVHHRWTEPLRGQQARAIVQPANLALMVSIALSTLLSLGTSEITAICARWGNRQLAGAQVYGLLQLKQLGPAPYPGATQADRMDAAVATVCRPRLVVPGT